MIKANTYLEFRGDEKIVLLKFLNSLVFRGNSTLHRILQSCTLKFLHLKKGNLE
jgi:hypothetical protein